MLDNTKMLINEISSDEVLARSYEWLCRRRLNYSHNSDIWDLRWNWEKEKSVIQSWLREGKYRFEALREYRFSDGIRTVWSARDALVLKALSLVLQPLIENEVSELCTHLTGRGGCKRAIRDVKTALPTYKHVVRSDVKSFYASIDHQVLFGQLRKFIDDRIVLDLLQQYMTYTTQFGGIYRDNFRGISLGCPLSPLMGALYLEPLDAAFADGKVFYRRFMDDWVILAKTRWHLRRAIRKMNKVLSVLKVEKHPDKTEINPTSKGFTFLGYSFSENNLTPAEKTLQNAKSKAARLQEQGATSNCIAKYWKNFWSWVKGGVSDLLHLDKLRLNDCDGNAWYHKANEGGEEGRDNCSCSCPSASPGCTDL